MGNTPFLVLFRAPKENTPVILSVLLSPLVNWVLEREWYYSFSLFRRKATERFRYSR